MAAALPAVCAAATADNARQQAAHAMRAAPTCEWDNRALLDTALRATQPLNANSLRRESDFRRIPQPAAPATIACTGKHGRCPSRGPGPGGFNLDGILAELPASCGHDWTGCADPSRADSFVQTGAPRLGNRHQRPGGHAYSGRVFVGSVRARFSGEGAGGCGSGGRSRSYAENPCGDPQPRGCRPGGPRDRSAPRRGTAGGRRRSLAFTLSP